MPQFIIRHNPRIIAFSLIITYLIFFSACLNDTPRRISPKAVKGVLDLSAWNFKKDGPADPADLPPEKGTLIGFSHQLPTLKQIEQLLIDEALKRSNGNQSIAALSLGISRQALNKRLKKSQHQPHDPA